MQQRSRLATRATALAVICCCALTVATAEAQSPPRRVTGLPPVNPLRAEPSATKSVLVDPAVRSAQATESLPTPLRQVPEQPELATPPQSPSATSRGEASVLAPRTQVLVDEPNLSWPGQAPAEQHYFPRHFAGNGQHHSYHEPREPMFSHGDPNDPARHTGWGDPLTGTSWLNRPWHGGVFVGGLLTGDLVADHVEQANAPILGFRLGHDFDHFWGWEGRYAFARTELFNGAGVPIVKPGRSYFVDFALLHYPWGDSRWRPYFLAGLGFANYRFEDDGGHDIDDTALTIPLGLGLKYYTSPWFSLRFEVLDTISVGSGQVDAIQNISLSAGVEFRFGGKRPSYFPWSGNTSYW